MIMINTERNIFSSVQFSSVAQCVRLFATPRTAASQASLSVTNSRSLLKLISIESVMPSNYLILCCPLLLQSFPASGSFQMSQMSLLSRWLKYQRFSFSVSPSNEHSGLISFILFFFSFFFFLILKSLILTCVPKHEPPSHLPPHNISLGHPHDFL